MSSVPKKKRCEQQNKGHLPTNVGNKCFILYPIRKASTMILCGLLLHLYLLLILSYSNRKDIHKSLRI